jgi:hypothetical protein
VARPLAIASGRRTTVHPPHDPVAVGPQMRQHTTEMEASGTALTDGQPHMMQHAHATDAWGEWHMFGVVIGMAITELGRPPPPRLLTSPPASLAPGRA